LSVGFEGDVLFYTNQSVDEKLGKVHAGNDSWENC